MGRRIALRGWVFFTLFVLTSTAVADLVPRPERPDWNDPPPPMPAPPEVVLIVAALVGACIAYLVRRRGLEPTREQR